MASAAPSPLSLTTIRHTAAGALLVLAVSAALLLLSGCALLPATRGFVLEEVEGLRRADLEQARLALRTAGALGDTCRAAKVTVPTVDALRELTQVQEERAAEELGKVSQRIEREQAAADGVLGALSGLLGGLGGGDLLGIIASLLGLGAGGYAVQQRGKAATAKDEAVRVKKKAIRLSRLQPEQAAQAVAEDPDLKDFRTLA
jgi:hypothetical protein